MQIQEQEVLLRKLIAGEGKIIVSKSVDEEGNPVVRAKEVYIPENASIDDFEEIDEEAEEVEEAAN